MPRQVSKNWAKTGVIVTILIGFLAMAVTLIISDLDIRDKQIGIIVVALLGYIVYNEATKAHAK